jgi:hypothetical protein
VRTRAFSFNCTAIDQVDAIDSITTPTSSKLALQPAFSLGSDHKWAFLQRTDRAQTTKQLLGTPRMQSLWSPGLGAPAGAVASARCGHHHSTAAPRCGPRHARTVVARAAGDAAASHSGPSAGSGAPASSSSPSSSAAAAAAATAGRPGAKKVVVVGGGWAGFGAAKHLSEQGYNVTLLVRCAGGRAPPLGAAPRRARYRRGRRGPCARPPLTCPALSAAPAAAAPAAAAAHTLSPAGPTPTISRRRP